MFRLGWKMILRRRICGYRTILKTLSAFASFWGLGRWQVCQNCRHILELQGRLSLTRQRCTGHSCPAMCGVELWATCMAPDGAANVSPSVCGDLDSGNTFLQKSSQPQQGVHRCESSSEEIVYTHAPARLDP